VSEFFAEYGFTIGSFSALFVAFITSGLSKFLKRNLADSVIAKFISKFKKDVGEENFNEITRIAKEYGVKKLEQGVRSLIENNVELANRLNEVESLFKVMLRNQIALGVYDDNPTLKQELIDKL
jgi:hypothetical protein